MPTDRARISFDPTRDYRSVVTQQGRVTLEADVNEQNSIASEALRLETIDIVGPCGTPDNGYEVAIGQGAHAGEIVIGPGTMYVGGWRLRLLEEITLTDQPDWADQPGASSGSSPAPALQTAPEAEAAPRDLSARISELPPASDELIALLVVEQEVTAVEDQALREVALGGPDTAARTRLMQHVIATPTKDTTCAAAAKDLSKQLAAMGLVLDPGSARLTFDAGLSVSFFPPATPADPCCPPAQGGYLGADNQLVRVTVTDFDAALGTGTLLWGWNNASFLYRAALVDSTANPQILSLSPAPVDAAHTPQPGEVVEVLRTTCVLGNPSDQNYIAAPDGVIVPLGAGSIFDPDSNQLTLPTGTPLPSAYQADTNPLFVRLWQAQVPFTHGQPAQLDAVSGLAVTLEMHALPTGPFEARPFWNFAVRPNTPQQVYPQRYLEARQGPSGPRLWLCDLAIVAPGDPLKQQPQLVADCRLPFLPLTGLDDQTSCCGITLDPVQVKARGGLQAVVDAQAKKKQPLSLQPGLYTLSAPLLLTRAHAGFTLSGCSGGAVRLQADPKALSAFKRGLIHISDTSAVTLRDLSLTLPRLETEIAIPPTVSGLPVTNPTQGTGSTSLAFTLLLGIYLESATQTAIEDCQFLFGDFTGSAANPAIFIGAGIFAQGDVSGLRLDGNLFLSPGGGGEAAGDYRALAGLCLIPATDDAQTETYLAQASHILDDSEINNNRFEGMTIASLVLAQLGKVRCSANLVRNSGGGFFFYDLDLGANAAFGRAALAAEQAGSDQAADAYAIRKASAPVLVATASYLAAAAVPAQAKAAAAQPPLAEEARAVLVADFIRRGTDAFKALSVAPKSAPKTQTEQQAGQQAPGAPAETVAAPGLDDATYKRTAAAYTLFENIGISAETAAATLTPVLTLRNNDITLVNLGQASLDAEGKPTADSSANGIQVVFAQRDGAGALLVQDNRVSVPNHNSMAAALSWAQQTIVTGNLFTQGAGGDKGSIVACVKLINREDDEVVVMANIVHSFAEVTPLRNSTTLPAADTWEFLNTEE